MISAGWCRAAGAEGPDGRAKNSWRMGLVTQQAAPSPKVGRLVSASKAPGPGAKRNCIFFIGATLLHRLAVGLGSARRVRKVACASP